MCSCTLRRAIRMPLDAPTVVSTPLRASWGIVVRFDCMCNSTASMAGQRQLCRLVERRERQGKWHRVHKQARGARRNSCSRDGPHRTGIDPFEPEFVKKLAGERTIETLPCLGGSTRRVSPAGSTHTGLAASLCCYAHCVHDSTALMLSFSLDAGQYWHVGWGIEMPMGGVETPQESAGKQGVIRAGTGVEQIVHRIGEDCFASAGDGEGMPQPAFIPRFAVVDDSSSLSPAVRLCLLPCKPASVSRVIVGALSSARCVPAHPSLLARRLTLLAIALVAMPAIGRCGLASGLFRACCKSLFAPFA